MKRVCSLVMSIFALATLFAFAFVGTASAAATHSTRASVMGGCTYNLGDSLQANTNSMYMYKSNCLFSSSGVYEFAYQSDGNLVIYHGTRPIWASNTQWVSSDTLVMQGDGNFVLYANYLTSHQYPVWASRSNRLNPSSYPYIVMQNDGNLVIYNGSQPIWASNTAGR